MQYINKFFLFLLFLVFLSLTSCYSGRIDCYYVLQNIESPKDLIKTKTVLNTVQPFVQFSSNIKLFPEIGIEYDSLEYQKFYFTKHNKTYVGFNEVLFNIKLEKVDSIFFDSIEIIKSIYKSDPYIDVVKLDEVLPLTFILIDSLIRQKKKPGDTSVIYFDYLSNISYSYLKDTILNVGNRSFKCCIFFVRQLNPTNNFMMDIPDCKNVTNRFIIDKKSKIPLLTKISFKENGNIINKSELVYLVKKSNERFLDGNDHDSIISPINSRLKVEFYKNWKVIHEINDTSENSMNKFSIFRIP